jgi:hypothetical protein
MFKEGSSRNVRVNSVIFDRPYRDFIETLLRTKNVLKAYLSCIDPIVKAYQFHNGVQ